MLIQNQITGPHPAQMTALRPPLHYPQRYEGLGGMRIAYSPNQGWARIDPEVRANTEAAVGSSPTRALRSKRCRCRGMRPRSGCRAQAGQTAAAKMYRQYDALFESGFDAFVCPTSGSAAMRADFDFTTDELEIDGEQVNPVTGWMLTPVFNLLYTVPVVNAPSGFDRHGVPTGFQIAARAFDDLTAFRVAAAYSEAAPAMYHGGTFPSFSSNP